MRNARTAMAILLTVLASAGRVDAQAVGGGTARVAVDLGFRPTLLAGGGAALFGGTALLGASHGPMFGGAGWIQLGESDVETGPTDAGFRLRLAYGGLVVAWELPETEIGRVTARLLVGAGNAKVFLKAGGLETATGSDNFGVVEPELAVSFPVTRRLRAAAGLSYRAVVGVEDLTGIDTADLRGPALRLGMAFLGG